MLTNLAYAGGGASTYSDTVSTGILTNGTGDSEGEYLQARYYISPSASVTTEPTNPSVVGNQYGYLYNWCAAMGGQSGACQYGGEGPVVVNQSLSICPAGWRLPTGGELGSGQGEFADLDRAFGGSGMTVWSGEPNTAEWMSGGQFMGALSGYWHEGFMAQGSFGYLWSGSPGPDYSGNALSMAFLQNEVVPGSSSSYSIGYAVRCLLG